MDYDSLRHFADTYVLAAMLLVFVVLCAWPFRPGSRSENQDAANLIFKDENDG